MHIPDGFLSTPVILSTAIVSTLATAAAALHRKRPSPQNRPILRAASIAALLFSSQMLNFPILGGTSGHLLGGLLAAVLLGPATALLVLASVLITQALLFADGGITSLGANLLNMGLIGTLGGYAIYRTLLSLHSSKLNHAIALALAAWCSVILAALACSLELILSGTAPAGLVLPAMLSTHAQIGLGEALITLIAASMLLPRSAPSLLPAQPSFSFKTASLFAILLAILSPFASTSPDALDHAAHSLGFSALAANPLHPALLNYTFPHIANPALSTILAALVGTCVAFLLATLISRTLRRATL